MGPNLFNTFLSDLFFVIDDIDFDSYADDNTVYWGGDSIIDVVLSLKDSAKKVVFHWFFDNQVEEDTHKWHLLHVEVEVGDSFMKNSTSEKLVGVKIDNKLSFDEHVKIICQRVNSKLRH